MICPGAHRDMGEAGDKVFTGFDCLYNNAADRAGDPDIRTLPYPELFHIIGVHMDDGAGVEVFLGRLACFHADTLVDGPACDHVQCNLIRQIHLLTNFFLNLCAS